MSGAGLVALAGASLALLLGGALVRAALGRRRVGVAYSAEHPVRGTERWPVELLARALERLDRGAEVRASTRLGRWEVAAVPPGRAARVEVVRGGVSTVLLVTSRNGRARFLEVATGTVVELVADPAKRLADGSLVHAGHDQEAKLEELLSLVLETAPGSLPNDGVERVEAALDALSSVLALRLTPAALFAPGAALALVDAVESGVPHEWAVRRVEAVASP